MHTARTSTFLARVQVWPFFSFIFFRLATLAIELSKTLDYYIRTYQFNKSAVKKRTKIEFAALLDEHLNCFFSFFPFFLLFWKPRSSNLYNYWFRTLLSVEIFRLSFLVDASSPLSNLSFLSVILSRLFKFSAPYLSMCTLPGTCLYCSMLTVPFYSPPLSLSLSNKFFFYPIDW